MKLLSDRVAIERVEEKPSSGIIIPDAIKEKPVRGKVIEVGSGQYLNGKLIPMTVKKGDKVLFTKYGGVDIRIDGKELTILKETDILAIL